MWQVTFWADQEHTWTDSVEIVADTGMDARIIWERRNPDKPHGFRDYKRLTPLNFEETESWIDGLEWTQDKQFRQALLFILHSMNARTKANEKS